jgi:Major Facilitator Superfamily.
MKAINKLLITQFLSAMADNMVLLATIHIITLSNLGDIYTGIVQASFFIAYVILAPYAGILSEKIAKSTSLCVGNAFKFAGTISLLLGVSPALSYAMVGVGACLYSPGKYALLREVTSNDEELYKANGLIEGSTITAILIGTVLGGFLAERNINLTMGIILACYVVSVIFATIIPKGEVIQVTFKGAWGDFGKDIKSLCSIKEAKVSLLGSSAFWMISAVVRLSALAWIPVALNIGDDKATLYMGATAVGIMVGAVVSHRLIPLNNLKRLVYIGFGMALTVGVIGFLPHLIITGILSFLAGFLGGAYMIPLNTILQQKGMVVGNGKTIAIQNFFENSLMVIGTLTYSGALKMGVTIPFILLGFGIIFALIVTVVQKGVKES